jgi:Tol biopolymer transport system component
VDSLGNPFDGIVTMKTDGSNARLLTNPLTTCTCYDENPAFTADGTKITFSRDRWDSTTSSDTEDMYIMNADGSGVTRLTSGAGINFDPMAVNVAGMGLLILFSSNRDNLSATGSSGFELYSMKLDGSGIMRVTNNTLYDAFSGEWYERGSSTAQRTAQPRASHHRLPFGYNTGQKVRW